MTRSQDWRLKSSKVVPPAKKLMHAHAWISHPHWSARQHSPGTQVWLSDPGVRVISSTKRDSLPGIPKQLLWSMALPSSVST